MIKVLILMLIFELFADSMLQFKLPRYKRKENCEQYIGLKQYIWIVALLVHGLIVSSFMILPMIVMKIHVPIITIIIAIILNILLHAYVDHYKCNMKQINYIEDRIIHITQVFLTWYILIQ